MTIRSYDWLLELNAEEIDLVTGDMKVIIDLIGLEAFVKFMNYFVGSTIYVSDACLSRARDSFIVRSNLNPQQLSRKVGITDKYIYRVLADKRDEKQLDLFK